YWDQIRNYLQSRVSLEGYANWLKGTTFVGLEGDTLYVSVPDRETRTWMETEYAGLVKNGIRELALPVRRVSFESQAIHGTRNQALAAVESSSEPDGPASALNPKFTFEGFVVGACNQFAHAAARSVATNPSRSYNPLFLYGGVGMGKTHLMHAIGRSLMTNSVGMRIIYTSSERFTNEVVSGIRLERMPQLRQR